VQRPRSVRRVAVDMFALRRVLELLRAVVGFKADVAIIADEVETCAGPSYVRVELRPPVDVVLLISAC
jgi:hypothetical protein